MHLQDDILTGCCFETGQSSAVSEYSYGHSGPHIAIVPVQYSSTVTIRWSHFLSFFSL